MGPNHALTTQYNKRWNRQMDHANEAAGYIVNVDIKRHLLQYLVMVRLLREDSIEFSF